MSTPTILLLHEEGPGVGLGHKYRMAALREALAAEGVAGLYYRPLGGALPVGPFSGTVIDARVPQAWSHQGQRVMVELDGTVRWDDGWSVSGPVYAMIRKGFRETPLKYPKDAGRVLLWPSTDSPRPESVGIFDDAMWIDSWHPGRATAEPWLLLANYTSIYCPASMRALEAACMGLHVDCYAYDEATRTIKGWLDSGAVIDGYGAHRVAKLILKRLSLVESTLPG